MAEKVVNSSLVLLSKFVASRQESASKAATSHIRKTLANIWQNTMKKGILITIIGIVIIGITYFGIEMYEFAKGVQEDIPKNKIEFEQKPIIKLTEFINGRWISTIDSLSGIEIKNGKWIMFYKGMKTDSSDVYDFKIRREYIKELGTEHKPFEFLTITNDSDTLEYSILEYSNELLSLSYIPRGNTLNYKSEK